MYISYTPVYISLAFRNILTELVLRALGEMWVGLGFRAYAFKGASRLSRGVRGFRVLE